MAKGFFITGTDTGVGKTVVAAALVCAIRSGGQSVCGIKPIESGCSRLSDVLIPPDGMFLKEISHAEEQINRLTQFCLEAPLAPMVAAELENVDIVPEYIKHRFDELSLKYDALVVEGIGGILVPIKKGFFVLDLMEMLELPVIVVASPYLGTINHTLLTVDCALRAGLDVAGVVMNFRRPFEGTPAEETNAHAIERLSPVPLIGVMPFVKDLDAEKLEAAAQKHLDMDALRKYL